MRILGFSKRWPKLNNPIFFTTFRYTRRDRDWEVEEVVQVVFKPRTKQREPLGIARIIRKQDKDTSKKFYIFAGTDKSPDVITPEDAYADGFSAMHGGGDINKLLDWLRESAGMRFYREPIVHKLTIYWIERWEK